MFPATQRRAVPWCRQVKELNGFNLTEWRFVDDMLYLNTDGVLLYELDDPNCNCFGDDVTGRFVIDCPERAVGDDYGDAVRDFADNNTLWLEEFAAAYTKMTEHMAPCKHLKTPVPRPDHTCQTYGPFGPFPSAGSPENLPLEFDFGLCDVELIYTKFAFARKFPYLRFYDVYSHQLPPRRTWRGNKGGLSTTYFNGTEPVPQEGIAPTFNQMKVTFRDSHAVLEEFEVCGECYFPGTW